MIESLAIGLGLGTVQYLRTHRGERPSRRRRRRPWQLPPLHLLSTPVSGTQDDLEATGNVLTRCLVARGVDVELVDVVVGPQVVRYELGLGDTRVSRFKSAKDDIGLALGTSSVRLLTPVPGKSVVGVEAPRPHRGAVGLADLMPALRRPLDIAVGVDVNGDPIKASLADSRQPHLLIAGATGSGKSVFVNAIVLSILLRSNPAEVGFTMIDPKRVELSPYEGLPHIVGGKIVTETAHAVKVLNGMVEDMDKRYTRLKKLGARDIEEAHTQGVKDMPYHVFVIDELADLMMKAGDEIEPALASLTALGRAAGFHGVIATQRPDVRVLVGTIKANVATRAAFSVSSGTDSRVILDRNGAEALSGNGDMLWSGGIKGIERAQAAYVDKLEIERIVQWWREQK